MIRWGALIVVVLGLLSPWDSATADVDAGSGENSFQLLIEETQGSTSETNPVASSGGTVTYSYQPVCIRGEGMPGEQFQGCGDQMRCQGDGSVFIVWAHHSDGTSTNLGSSCIGPDDPDAPAQQVTQAAAYQAFRRIPLPSSEVAIQPPGGETLVNLDTIFSTRADGFTETVGLLGHRVDFDIAPSEFRWVNGDGTEQVTDWAGKPWAKGTPLHEFITHRYDDAHETVQPRVDTTWSAQYRVDGGPWRDVGGTVTIDGEPFDLEVLSAEPHLAG